MIRPSPCVEPNTLPLSFTDEPLGSRRQPKMKYVYRLLRQGDIGEALVGKTVRLGSRPATTPELLSTVRLASPLSAAPTRVKRRPAAHTSSNVEGQWVGSFACAHKDWGLAWRGPCRTLGSNLGMTSGCRAKTSVVSCSRGAVEAAVRCSLSGGSRPLFSMCSM